MLGRRTALRVYACVRSRLACFFWRAVTCGPGALSAAHNSRLRFRRKIFFLRKRPNLDLSPLRSDKQLLLFFAPRLPPLRRTGPLAGASFTQYGLLAWLRLC